MKKILNFVLVFIMLIAFNVMPVTALALGVDTGFDVDSLGGPLVPCGAEKTPIENTTDASGKPMQSGGKTVNQCEFAHIFLLINKIISFVFKVIVVPIAAIMFVYAGFLMLFSGGNAGKSEKAKGIFMSVLFGLVIAAAAWLIVHEILNFVGIQPHIDTFGL